MNVTLLQIDAPKPPDRGEGEFDVRVLIDIDGMSEWHDIHVRPRVIPEFDAGLLTGSEALEDRFQWEQYALHRIYRVVGRALRGEEARVPQLIAACAGILLLVGLWTPVVGSLIAAVELWIAIANGSDPWIPIVLAILGATIAMIGPGAWSIDARLFGRKHITT